MSRRDYVLSKFALSGIYSGIITLLSVLVMLLSPVVIHMYPVPDSISQILRYTLWMWLPKVSCMKNVRRIRIVALSTAGAAANKNISAAEFYLYEKYEKKMPSSYLSDMTLGEWDASVVKDTTKKNVTVPAGVSITADLIGKEFDEFAAKMAVKGIAANENATVKVYGDRKLIHQFDTSTGDVEKMLLLDIAGIRMLKVEVSGAAGAKVTLSDAKFRNQANKDQVFLVSGDQAVLSENVALVQEDIGKAAWSRQVL